MINANQGATILSNSSVQFKFGFEGESEDSKNETEISDGLNNSSSPQYCNLHLKL